MAPSDHARGRSTANARSRTTSCCTSTGYVCASHGATPSAPSKATRRRPGTHNERRPPIVRRVLDMLVARYKAAAVRAYRERNDIRGARARPTTSRACSNTPRDSTTRSRARWRAGEAPPDGWEQELRSRLRALPDVKEALERMWPALAGTELVNDLLGFRALVRSAADGILTEDEQLTAAPPARAQHRARARGPTPTSRSSTRPTRCSVRSKRPGPARRRRRNGDDTLDTATRVIENLGLEGYADAATLAERFGEPTSNGHDVSIEPRTFGHVLVDEAQDLTRDAVAHARPPLPFGLDDARRRPGPGQQAGCGRVLGRDARAPSDAQPAALRHAHDQLPHSGRSDGGGIAAARGGGADRRAVALGPPHRRGPALRPRRGRRPRRRSRRTHARRARPHRHGRGDRARRPAVADRRRPRRHRRAHRYRRRARRPGRRARPVEREGPRVRPRRRRRTVEARDRGSRRAAPALRHDHADDQDADHRPRRRAARGPHARAA